MLGNKLWANLLAIGTIAIPSVGNCATIPVDLSVKAKSNEISKKLQKKDKNYSDEAAANVEPFQIKPKQKEIITKKAALEKPKTTKIEAKIADKKSNVAITKANLPKTEYISEEQMMLELGLFGQNDSVKKVKSTKPNGVAPWQKIGSPYQVNGTWYIPAFEGEYDETGMASWYGEDFNGKATANGEIFDMNEVSIAHPTLPMPSMVEIINLENGRSIIARVNDRGPFVDGRLIDVSKRAAELLGFKAKGKAKVRVKYIGYANPSKEKQNTIFALDKLNPKLDKNPIKMANSDIAPANIAPNNMVQIGAFVNREYAEKFIKNRDDFKNLKIVETNTNIGKFYRVYNLNAEKITPAQKTHSQDKLKPIDHNSILASL